MNKLKDFLKKQLSLFRPIYHGIYLLFIGLEIFVCIYYYKENPYNGCNEYLSAFIEWCKTIEWNEISREIASFNSMIGMQAICTAIIIFLYSRYNEGTQGIRSEYLIEYKMGKKTVSIYRITSLLLPCFSMFFDKIHWYGAAVVSAVFLYYIICVYVILISILMRRDKISKLIQKMIHKEILDMETKLRCYITKEVLNGYFVILPDESNLINKITRKKKIQLQNKNQVYQELKSKTISWTFGENRQYELSLTVQDIFEEISELRTENVIINYIYMYDLIVEILNVDLSGAETWKVSLIDKMVIKLDEKNNIYKNPHYEILYYAIICAILQHGKKNEKNYLWFAFFETQRKRNSKMAKKLFAFSLGFLELLRRTNLPDEYFSETIVKTYGNKFKETLYSVEECFDDYIDDEFCDKYSVVLSIIGCGYEGYIKNCYRDVQMDLKNIGNKNYFVKTIIRSI